MARRLPGKKLRKVEVRANQRTYTLDLRVVDNSRSGYNSTVDLTYHIITDDPCEVRVSDTDPNECVKKAQQSIRDQMNIEWKDVLHVSVGRAAEQHERWEDDPPPEDAVEQWHGFKLRWKRKQVGMRGDEPVHRRSRNKPESIWPGELEVGCEEGRFHDEDALVYAVIDDTPENRAALHRIGGMLDVLQREMNRLLEPKMIAKTLLDVAKRMPLMLAMESAQPEEIKPATVARPRKARTKKAAKKTAKKKAAKRKGRRG